eukprot:gene22614-biopygen11761
MCPLWYRKPRMLARVQHFLSRDTCENGARVCEGQCVSCVPRQSGRFVRRIFADFRARSRGSGSRRKRWHFEPRRRWCVARTI